MTEPSFLKKIQDQPELTRKTIFWFLAVVLGILFLGLWISLVKQRMTSFDREKFNREINLPPLNDQLKDLPNFEIPQIDESQLKELEDLLKEESSQ